MEVVRGVVSRVTRSAEVVDSNDGVAVSQVVSCLIGGRSVEMSMPRLPNIHDGDEVVVAGWQKNGTVFARAYRNLSNGSRGRNEYQAYTLFILDPLVIGFSVVFPPLLLFALPWAFWTWFQAIRTFRAYRAVQRRTAPQGGGSRAFEYDYGDSGDVAEPLPLPPAPPPLPRPAAPPSPPLLPPAATRDIRFNCPKCGKGLRMSAANVGRRVKCSARDCAAVIDTSSLAG